MLTLKRSSGIGNMLAAERRPMYPTTTRAMGALDTCVLGMRWDGQTVDVIRMALLGDVLSGFVQAGLLDPANPDALCDFVRLAGAQAGWYQAYQGDRRPENLDVMRLVTAEGSVWISSTTTSPYSTPKAEMLIGQIQRRMREIGWPDPVARPALAAVLAKAVDRHNTAPRCHHATPTPADIERLCAGGRRRLDLPTLRKIKHNVYRRDIATPLHAPPGVPEPPDGQPFAWRFTDPVPLAARVTAYFRGRPAGFYQFAPFD